MESLSRSGGTLKSVQELHMGVIFRCPHTFGIVVPCRKKAGDELKLKCFWQWSTIWGSLAKLKVQIKSYLQSCGREQNILIFSTNILLWRQHADQTSSGERRVKVIYFRATKGKAFINLFALTAALSLEEQRHTSRNGLHTFTSIYMPVHIWKKFQQFIISTEL